MAAEPDSISVAQRIVIRPSLCRRAVRAIWIASLGSLVDLFVASPAQQLLAGPCIWHLNHGLSRAFRSTISFGLRFGGRRERVVQLGESWGGYAMTKLPLAVTQDREDAVHLATGKCA